MKPGLRFELNPRRVRWNPAFDCPETLIRDLCDCVGSDLGIQEGDAFFEQVMRRERESSTYLGHEVAIPHARIASLPNIEMAVARLDQPVFWSNGTDQPARIGILLLVPIASIQPYLELMRALIHGFRKKDLARRILEASDASGIARILSKAISEG